MSSPVGDAYGAPSVFFGGAARVGQDQHLRVGIVIGIGITQYIMHCDCDWDWCEQFQRTARRKRRSNKTYRFDQKYTFFEQQNYSKLRKQRMRRRAQYTSTVDGDSDHSLWYSTPSLTGRACRLIALFMHDLSLFVKFWPKDDFFLLVKTHKGASLKKIFTPRNF